MPTWQAIQRKVRSGLLGVTLIAVVAAVPQLSATPANGDPIGDLQARAEQVTAEMADLQGQIRANTNAVEVARYRSSQLNEEIAAARERLSLAGAKESSARRELRSFALQAYVSGGSDGGSGMTDILGTSGDKLGQRKGYVSASVGDRQQLVDDLNAAQKVVREQRLELEAAKGEADAARTRAEAKQQQAQEAADRLAAIKDQLDGQLKILVAERQAAQARAEQERVQAQVAAEAVAAARQDRVAAQARSTPTVSVPPVVAGSASPSTPSGANGFVPAPNASAASIAIAAARSQLGVPYSWGGGNASGPSYGFAQGAGIRGFDCSGLTLYAYAQAGISLSHLTWDQMKQGRVVPVSQIEPGDLVFYWGGGHMALYIGGGQVIHAPQTGDVVKYGSLYMGTPELVVRPTG